jgi:hypothetical protein
METMISEEGRKAISEAQKKRHAAKAPVCAHLWLADEYITNSSGMALKWVYCPNCDERKQVRAE